MSNNNNSKALVFQLYNNGLFSELNNMMLGYLYCLSYDIPFELCSLHSTNFFSRGWQDYFLPFCNEFNSAILNTLDFRSTYSTSTVKKSIKTLSKFCLNYIVQPIAFPNKITMFTLWKEIRELRNRETISFNINHQSYALPLQQALHVVHNNIWRYNSESTDYINTTIHNMQLPTEYAGFHIRRGDKVSEAALVQESQYLALLLQHSPSVKDIYVTTDSFQVVEHLRSEYPNLHFYTLCTPEERGYTNEDFHRLPPLVRKEKILRLLAEMEIHRNAHSFIGTYSSNIGVYQGIARASNTFGVDYDNWVFW